MATLLFARVRRATVASLLTVALGWLALSGAPAQANTSGYYEQTNLVSDTFGIAAHTDLHLVNPWGIAFTPTGPIWIADNGTGFSTVYDAQGRGFPTGSPLVVTIPPPRGSAPGTTAAPTGMIFNGTGNFAVSAHGVTAPSVFLFATEDGTISGWNPTVDHTHAILAMDRSAAGAVYKGLAMGFNASGAVLFATNFHAGTVETFDSHFRRITTAGHFHDNQLPAGYAPFGIANFGGKLYVTFAKQNAEKHDDAAGAGRGFVDVFDTDGHLLRRLVQHGKLNSPWGMAMAPAQFGQFSGALLVGNFGDGRINAYDPATGAFLGTLRNEDRQPIVIGGLWGLTFGNGALAGSKTTLFFTAGIGHEGHGLFGEIESEP